MRFNLLSLRRESPIAFDLPPEVYGDDGLVGDVGWEAGQAGSCGGRDVVVGCPRLGASHRLRPLAVPLQDPVSSCTFVVAPSQRVCYSNRRQLNEPLGVCVAGRVNCMSAWVQWAVPDGAKERGGQAARHSAIRYASKRGPPRPPVVGPHAWWDRH